MNHWQRVAEYKGKTIRVYDGRLVQIIGPDVPGSAWCRVVDGGSGISHVCTSFLSPENVVAVDVCITGNPAIDGVCGDIDCPCTNLCEGCGKVLPAGYTDKLCTSCTWTD